MKKLDLLLVLLLVGVFTRWAYVSLETEPTAVVTKREPVVCKHRFVESSSTPITQDIFLRCSVCGLRRPYNSRVTVTPKSRLDPVRR
jgi:hypothetical protein